MLGVFPPALFIYIFCMCKILLIVLYFLEHFFSPLQASAGSELVLSVLLVLQSHWNNNNYHSGTISQPVYRYICSNYVVY